MNHEDTNTTKVEKPYGYQVTYSARTGEKGFFEAKFHCKGTETTARRSAALKHGFLRVIELEAFTKDQYIRCFGEGRM